MSLLVQQLISKIIDDGSTAALAKYGLKPSELGTVAEQDAAKSIVKYASENGGRTPSLATFLADNPGVEYIAGVTDSYDYLIKEIREESAKKEIARIISDSTTLQTEFDAMSTRDFVKALTKRLQDTASKTETGARKLTDITADAGVFLTEYQARKAGTSFKIWRSKFASINKQIGGYFSGNTYAWYARSGRGKSVLVMEDGAIEAAFQGATVLIWALEMSEFEWMARAYSSISARISETIQRIEGVDYTVGFDNRAMLMGKLGEAYERGLADFCAMINDVVPGKLLLRAADSDGFTNRSITQLEADIRETEADVVVVDPIYLMDYEANTSRVAGGDVAATSVKIKRLAGQTKTVIHIVTQADEDASEKNEDGTRELKPPKRAEIKKSKAILEDAANVFGIDTLAHEGRGVIELGKGRNGGEDTRVEIVYLPNWGIVQETDLREQAEQFANVSGF